MRDKGFTIRGHHLLCMLGFRGLGYDERFVKNMSGIVAAIRRNADVTLALADRCDDICSTCPHNTEGRCGKKPGSEDTTRKFDRTVLARLGLLPGEELTAQSVYESVMEHVAPKDLEAELCTTCQWRGLGYCEEGLRALHAREFFVPMVG